MKINKEEVKPNYAPVYAAMYPDLAKLFLKHGYALAIHGSLARDFDLIAVAWAGQVSSRNKVILEMLKEFAITKIGKATRKEHGRIAYTFSVGFGECALDLSFIN